MFTECETRLNGHYIIRDLILEHNLFPKEMLGPQIT